jgi:hypothetical protein
MKGKANDRQALLRKQLIARTLMWSFLAAAGLPTSAAVLGFIWYGSMDTAPMTGLGFAMAVWRWWWLPIFPSMGFVLALEWKQGLDERIKQAPDHGTKEAA